MPEEQAAAGPPADEGDDRGDALWRVEELAARCGVGVDTIRFYQREGLLPAGVRSGRHKLYGPRHARRIERIKRMQSQGFSLAGIRSLLEAGLPTAVLSALDDQRTATYTRGELAEATGVPEDLVAELEAVGFLPAPTDEAGHDDADLGVLEVIRDLLDAGLPAELLPRVAAIYAEGFARMESEMLELLAGDERGALAPLMQDLEMDPQRFLRRIEHALHYQHTRTLERLMREVRGASTHPGAG